MTATAPAAPRSVRPVLPCHRPRDGTPNAGRLAPAPLGAGLRAQAEDAHPESAPDAVSPSCTTRMYTSIEMPVHEYKAGCNLGDRQIRSGQQARVPVDRSRVGTVATSHEARSTACRRAIPTSSR